MTIRIRRLALALVAPVILSTTVPSLVRASSASYESLTEEVVNKQVDERISNLQKEIPLSSADISELRSIITESITSKQERGVKTWIAKQILKFALKMCHKHRSAAWIQLASAKLAGAERDVEKKLYKILRSISVPKKLAKHAAKVATMVIL